MAFSKNHLQRTMDKVVKILLCLLGFLFHTSLYLLVAQLSLATQTQQVLVAGFVWCSFLFVFCNKLFAISVAGSHYAKGETGKASV